MRPETPSASGIHLKKLPDESGLVDIPCKVKRGLSRSGAVMRRADRRRAAVPLGSARTDNSGGAGRVPRDQVVRGAVDLLLGRRPGRRVLVSSLRALMEGTQSTASRAPRALRALAVRAAAASDCSATPAQSEGQCVGAGADRRAGGGTGGAAAGVKGRHALVKGRRGAALSS